MLKGAINGQNVDKDDGKRKRERERDGEREREREREKDTAVTKSASKVYRIIHDYMLHKHDEFIQMV